MCLNQELLIKRQNSQEFCLRSSAPLSINHEKTESFIIWIIYNTDEFQLTWISIPITEKSITFYPEQLLQKFTRERLASMVESSLPSPFLQIPLEGIGLVQFLRTICKLFSPPSPESLSLILYFFLFCIPAIFSLITVIPPSLICSNPLHSLTAWGEGCRLLPAQMLICVWWEQRMDAYIGCATA